MQNWKNSANKLIRISLFLLITIITLAVIGCKIFPNYLKPDNLLYFTFITNYFWGILIGLFGLIIWALPNGEQLKKTWKKSYLIFKLVLRRIRIENQTVFFIIIIAIVVIGITKYFPINEETEEVFHDLFTYRADPFFAIIAGLFGIVIWINQKRNQVLTEIPKRMTVHFVVKNASKTTVIASCYEAVLAHEGDIRNYSQQIGKQMLGGNLNLHPYFEIGKAEIKRSETEATNGNSLFKQTTSPHNKHKKIKGLIIKHYKVTLYLDAKSAKDILSDGKAYKRNRTIARYETQPDSPISLTYSHKKDEFLSEIMSLKDILNEFSEDSKSIINQDKLSVINQDIFFITTKIEDFKRQLGYIAKTEDKNIIAYFEKKIIKATKSLEEMEKEKRELNLIIEEARIEEEIKKTIDRIKSNLDTKKEYDDNQNLTFLEPLKNKDSKSLSKLITQKILLDEIESELATIILELQTINRQIHDLSKPEDQDATAYLEAKKKEIMAKFQAKLQQKAEQKLLKNKQN